MQTQNTDVILPLLEMRVEKALRQGFGLVERLNADHNTYIDRELLVTVHDRKHKGRGLQPRTTDNELTLRPAATQAFGNVSSAAWVAAILAIVGVLTAMLMIGIAISV